MNPITQREQAAAGRESATRDDVREYYGRVLQGREDLRTSACCPAEALPDWKKAILAEIDDEIVEKSYGCGSPLPPLLSGATVLDIGCGTGRDAYRASRLVGPHGRVIGIDMTEEQLAVARKYVELQTRRFGYDEPNVSFRHGTIEDLGAAGIADESIDVVISNCVINLSPDKRSVFSEILRVLKRGGELCFSDVFAGRRVPEELRDDPVLYGECLAGAMYVGDFGRLMRDVGCLDYRVLSTSPIRIEDKEIDARIGMIDFHAMTIRAFKLGALEDECEDYGQIATYRGTIPGHRHAFALDNHHEFLAGKPVLVCGNTASMLCETRYARHFRVVGDRRTHYGAFDCGPAAGRSGEEGAAGGACC